MDRLSDAERDERISRTVSCPVCKARPGEPCKTNTRWAHPSRYFAANPLPFNDRPCPCCRGGGG